MVRTAKCRPHLWGVVGGGQGIYQPADPPFLGNMGSHNALRTTRRPTRGAHPAALIGLPARVGEAAMRHCGLLGGGGGHTSEAG